MNTTRNNQSPTDELPKNSPKQNLWQEGLWRNNAGLVQLLGLCPLLAVSNSVINGLGLGLATLFTLLFSNLIVSLLRHRLQVETRIIVYVLIIASLVTVVEMLMSAFLHEIYLVLGLFIPLIVTNCMIVGRAEAFASRNRVSLAVIDALATGIGFLLVLVVLGGLRELIGYGTLFRDAHFLLGEQARHWVIEFDFYDHGLLIALLPPGAFFILGLMVAAKNGIDQLSNRTHVSDRTHGTEPANLK